MQTFLSTCKNSCKLIVLEINNLLSYHLRNVLFAKSEEGASISSRIFSIIQTATANSLIVDKYLEYVLENINKLPIDDILPWSEKLPKSLSIKQYLK